MPAGSKLVADRFEAKFHYAIWFEPASNQLKTSFEPASVMEFCFIKSKRSIERLQVKVLRFSLDFSQAINQRPVYSTSSWTSFLLQTR